MPRKPREFLADGIYHVFNRGNNRQVIFKSPEDFNCFKRLLKAGQDRENVEIYHYCLMSNHFHLLMKSRERESLPRFMHWVQLGYTRYFKRKHQTTGHLFEERYRSPRIADDSYYLQCGRYIERNPVKAKLVKEAFDYPHSSARYYALGQKDLILTENVHYLGLGYNDQERQLAYKKFVHMEEPYAELISDQLLKY
jgi:putative transposase